MALLIGTVTGVSIAKDGWSAWVTLEGLGYAGSPVTYNLNPALKPMLRLSVTDASGAIREVLATQVVRKPSPEENELDHKIVGDDLVVRVALSEFVFSTSRAVAFAEEHWASTILDGQPVSSLATQRVPVVNFSEISSDGAASIANFVTPDRQLVGAVIHVEVIAGSIFANAGAEVASVRFVARDQHGNEVSVKVDAQTLSAWGKGDARPVYSYSADIPTAGLADGDLITVRAEVTDQIGNVRVSAPNGSVPANPTAFTDQVYLLDADGSFGKAYAYVDNTVAPGSGVANADPILAATTPFKTIAAALVATQVFNQQNFGRANLDNAEIRLKAGTHVWVNGNLTSQQASTDDVWLTITRDPAATIGEVRLTGAIDGRNSFAVADHIKIEGLTIDRAPMGSSTAAIMRGQSNDSLWLHDIVFEGDGQRAVSFQIPDIWVTQSDFNGTSRALTTFGTDINMFRIRGIEADAGAGNIINGHLLVGSNLHNLAVRYPVTANTPNANGSVIAYNEISVSSSTQILALNGVRDVAVIGNVFSAIRGSSPAISISADGATSDISNIVFHNNTVLNERMNVGYNDVFGQNFEKTLISVKWNDVFQLNTKHDVFSADSRNTGAWSVLYGVGFESNVVHTQPAGSRVAFGFAYDGAGSSGNGLLQPVPQQDIPDIAPVGSPPVAVADNFMVSEDSVLAVTAAQGVLANDYDVDGDALQAALVTGPRNGNLTLNADGSFSYVPLPNFYGQDSFRYTTGAGIHLSEPVTVVITVQGVNDVPFARDDFGTPSFPGDVVRFGSDELLANDTDSDADTLSLISVQDAVNGSVELVNGEVVFSLATGAVVEGSFSYTESDNQGGFATATVRVPLLVQANQSPVFVSAAAAQISENQNAVLRVEGTTRGGVDRLGYSLAGGPDAALFAIDASTGELSFMFAPDFEAPADADGNNIYEVTIRVSDGTLTSDQLMTVAVTDINDASPLIVSNGGGTTAEIEMPENRIVVTTVIATGADAGATIAYSISGGADAALFAIDAITGALTFLSTPDFEVPVDLDGDSVYEVIVRAGDGELADDQVLAVTVTNVNDLAPAFSSAAALSVPENTAAVGIVVAADPDALGAISYSISGGADAELFAIDASTGELSFAFAPDFETPADADDNNVYEVTIRASDGALTSDQTMTVAVTDIADANPPSNATLATSAILENAVAGTVVGTVVGVDPDVGDVLTYSLVDNAAGRFAIDAATGILTVANGATIDFEVAISHAISVKVTDAAGASANFAFTIAVTNVNDLAPAFSSSAARSLAENSTAVGIVLATDPDALGAISYSITGGADAALFAIDSATGALRFVAEPNFELPLDAGANNIYDLIVTASDGGLTTPQAITVAVTDAIEVPTQTYTGTALADIFAVSDSNGWTLSGLAGDDRLTGGAKPDVLIGGRNNDILVGGAGDDVFKFAAGDGIDSYDGGIGFDKIVATTANAVIAISAISGIEVISSDSFANVSIIGTTAADTLDFSGTTLTGITQIDAGGGNDTVIGSAGSDTIVLGSGNDIFRAGNGNDIFIARASAGSDIIDGGAGFDTINAGAINVAINVAALTSIEAINANGFTGVSLVGSTLADVLDFSSMALTGISFIDAGSGNDTVIGSAGNDTIVLGSGNDILSGSDGNDIFLAKAGAGLDVIDGGIGYDTVLAAAANVSITLASFSRIEEISANGFAGVKLVGSSAADTMNYTGVTLTGIDSISGGAGNDTITGAATSDRILGGTGRDVMTGGLGADTFVFATSAESGFGATRADLITDFLSGTDVIDLTAIDADTSIVGNQAFTFIGSAAFTGLGQLRIGVDTDGKVALFGNTTGSLTADFQISFDNNPALMPADIYL